MIIKTITRYIILLASLFFLACSGKYYNPKIEKGIFSEKKK